jgi:hypothetical protein
MTSRGRAGRPTPRTSRTMRKTYLADGRTPAGRGAPQHGAPDVARAACRWVAYKPAERAPVAAAPLLYGTGGAMHLADAPWWGIGPASAAIAAATAVTVWKNTANLTLGRKTGLGGAAITGWLTWAAEVGPFYGPHAATLWAYIAAYATGYGLYRADSTIKAGIRRRNTRRAWPAVVARIPELAGSRWASSEQTRTGVAHRINVLECRATASALAGNRAVEERIAAEYGLPRSRVQIGEDRIAGHVRIRIKLNDPWREPIAHPVTVAEHEITLPVPASIRDPLVIGQDPDTGRALALPLWTPEGARHTLIVAINGGGKTGVVNDVLERASACPDVLIWPIDLAKRLNFGRWAPVLDWSALGEGERVTAVRILEAAAAIIRARADTPRPTANHEPTPADPYILIPVDETDTLTMTADRYQRRIIDALRFIVSKGRSESVGLLMAAHRGTARMLGGADTRIHFKNLICLRVQRPSEVTHLGLDPADLPDMSKYGEGKAGVAGIVTDTGIDLGRAFFLVDPPTIEALAAQRAAGRGQLPAHLAEMIGDAYRHRHTPPTTTAGAVQPQLPRPRQAAASEWSALARDLSVATPEQIAEARAAYRRRAEQIIEHQRRDLPEITEQLQTQRREAAREERLRDPVPEHVRATVLAALTQAGPDGLSRAELADHLDLSKARTAYYLAALRDSGAIAMRGESRAARWHLPDRHGQ